MKKKIIIGYTIAIILFVCIILLFAYINISKLAISITIGIFVLFTPLIPQLIRFVEDIRVNVNNKIKKNLFSFVLSYISLVISLIILISFSRKYFGILSSVEYDWIIIVLTFLLIGIGIFFATKILKNK